MAPISKAVTLIDHALVALGYTDKSPAELYEQIESILHYLDTEVHAVTPISVVTTGAILEQLCRYGLEAAIAGTKATLHRMPQQWKWVGDFSIPGDPFNLVISVKSFKARERLLASGSGSVMSPTIGWGAFNDAREFTPNRIASYAYRGFVGLYMPEKTRDALKPESLAVMNINGRPFVRPQLQLVQDVRSAIDKNGRINPRLL